MALYIDQRIKSVKCSHHARHSRSTCDLEQCSSQCRSHFFQGISPNSHLNSLPFETFLTHIKEILFLPRQRNFYRFSGFSLTIFNLLFTKVLDISKMGNIESPKGSHILGGTAQQPGSVIQYTALMHQAFLQASILICIFFKRQK